MLKEIILEKLNDESKVKNLSEFRINPSALSKCRRALWFEYREPASDPIPPHSMLKMRMGDSAHDTIRELLKDCESVKIIEQEVDKETTLRSIKVRYRIDAIVEINNMKVILEIKSTYSNGWNRVSVEPDAGHITQLKTYMLLEKVRTGILFYIARDNGLVAEHIVSLTRKELATYKKELIKKMKAIKNVVFSKTTPPRDYNLVVKENGEMLDFSKSDWQCRYCVYRTRCYKEKN